MTKSKMMEVAKILGVDIGQQFKIKGYVSKYELQNDGVHFCGNNETVRGYILERLLTGKDEIEKPILNKVENSTEILHKVINNYGINAQLDMCIEEMSELTKEICKRKRGKDNKEEIIEEMVDVYIMLEQLKIICDIEQDQIENVAVIKILRLEERLQQ